MQGAETAYAERRRMHAEARKAKHRIKRQEKKRLKQEMTGAAVRMSTGAVSLQDAKTTAKYAKANWPKILLGLILINLPIIAITIMFISNAQPAVDFESTAGMLARGYSKDTWDQQIAKKKALETAVVEVSKQLEENKKPGFEGALTNYSGLSKERFSTDKGYAEDYVEINNTILAAAEEYAPLNIDGLELKGLWLLTQITSESGLGNNNPAKTLIMALPTAVIDVTKDNINDKITNTGIVDYFSNPKLYNNKGRFNTIWWREDSWDGTYIYTQQGPFTMQASNWTNDCLKGRTSEWEKIEAAGESLKTIINTYGSRDLYSSLETWCWGGDKSQDGDISVATCGDRFNIPDAFTSLSDTTQKTINSFIEWYKGQGYSFLSDYEKITWIRMMHWLPNFYNVSSFHTEDIVAYIKGLNSEATHKLFMEAVDEALEKWSDPSTALAYRYAGHDTYITLFNKTFIYDVHQSAMTEAKKIYPEFKEENLIKGTTAKFTMDEKGNKVELYQMASCLTYYKFDYMLYERLFNEGGSTSD